MDGKLHGIIKTFEDGELVSSEKYEHGTFMPAKEKKDADSLVLDDERKWWQIFMKKAHEERVEKKSIGKSEKKDRTTSPEPEKKGIKNWFKKKERPKKENEEKKEDPKKKTSDDKKSKP